MFGSGVLDTVIGLTFVFLLVSLLVTTFNEFISAILLSRAKWLEYGIHRLIGSKWALALYQHPLIESSSQRWTAPSPLNRWRRLIECLPGMKRTAVPSGADAEAQLRWRGAGPSYIPSRAFANVLMELLQGEDKVVREAERALQKMLQDASIGAKTAAAIRTEVAKFQAALPQDMAAEVKKVIGPSLQRLSAILDRNAEGRMDGWLAELEACARDMTDAALSPTQTGLAKLVTKARSSSPGLAQIRADMVAAIDELPSGVIGDMPKAKLNLLLSRLEMGYSVGDAIGDAQQFIRGLPADYVRELIQNLPNTGDDDRLRKTLLALYDDAANDVEKFKQNIEVWFNNAMDRVGGWYKRQAQWVTFGISLAVVVLMNVDALLIVRYLDSNPNVAKALATQAQAFVDAKAKETHAREPAAPAPPVAGDKVTGTLHFSPAPKTAVKAVFTTTEGGTFRPPWVMVEAGATSVPYTLDTAFAEKPAKATISADIPDAGVTPDILELQPSYPAQLRHIQEQLMGLRLPIGWSRNPTQAEQDMHLGLADWEDRWEYWDAFVFHWLGWLITAIAATLGAPFWFDMLNKVMSIRSAGKAPEEKSKSPDVVQAPMAPGQSPKEASRLAALAESGKR